jgi:hypothetical protein
MKKMLVSLLVGIAMVMSADAQNFLNWFTLSEPIGPGGSTVSFDGGNPSNGAMVQLILAYNTASLPTLSGDGATGGNQVIDWTGCGFGAFDATFSQVYSMDTGTPTLGTTNYVFVRIWDRPTSGSGNVPTSFDYGSGNVGAYYFDAPVAQISSLPNSGGLYDFQMGSVVQGSWTLLAIPEPTSMALGLLGLGVLAIRRRLMRK